MRVLVACEREGRVRDAFNAAGHDAMSCDIEPSAGHHYQGDIRDILDDGWDLMIAHPPCTDLAVSGARWFADKDQGPALAFVALLWNAPVRRVCIENPVSVLSTRWRPPDQIIHPWMFGHPESKTTCLWQRMVPPLIATGLCETREPVVHRMPPSPDRARQRSATSPGIAQAMADQWSHLD